MVEVPLLEEQIASLQFEYEKIYLVLVSQTHFDQVMQEIEPGTWSSKPSPVKYRPSSTKSGCSMLSCSAMEEKEEEPANELDLARFE